MLPGADGPETAHHAPPRGAGLRRGAGECPGQSLVAQAIQNCFVVRIVEKEEDLISGCAE